LEIDIAKAIENKKSLDELVYKDKYGRVADSQEIKNILLLHNVHTTLKSDNEKPFFSFELYKEQDWSLEHIYAQNSQSLTDTAKQKEWLSDHIKSLCSLPNNNSNIELITRMETMKEQDEIDNNDFDNIEKEVFELTEKCYEFENDENIHLLKNLCLLDKATNSQLSNSVFDVKREKIKKRELDGYYIPICTKYLFLKAYTAFPATNAYWTKAGRNDYFNDIENAYKFFKDKLRT